MRRARPCSGHHEPGVALRVRARSRRGSRSRRSHEAQRPRDRRRPPRASPRRTTNGGSRARSGPRRRGREGATAGWAPPGSARARPARPRRGSRGSPRRARGPGAGRTPASRSRGSAGTRPRRSSACPAAIRARATVGRPSASSRVQVERLDLGVHADPGVAQPLRASRGTRAPRGTLAPRAPPRTPRRRGPRSSPSTCSSPPGISRPRPRVTALISTPGTSSRPSGSGAAPRASARGSPRGCRGR